MLTPGTIVDGRFEIVELIGEGGMGTVYSARHKAMDRTIALKLLKSNLLAQEDKVARFRNEARVLSGLDHPNIVGIHAVGVVSETGQPYMAMDIVQGESLADVLAVKGPFAQDDAVRICIQICDGLQYAHDMKIIHRDIKPSNIILAKSGETSVPKLVDFGIAKMIDPQFAQQLTQTGAALGSAFYLSPGQMEGRMAEPASDIYSLGCTLYEMLAGAPPFVADTFFETAMMHRNDALVPVNQRNPQANISRDVQAIIDMTLEKEHHARYQSADELKEDLQRASQGGSLKFAKAKGETSPAIQNKKQSRKLSPRITLISAVVAALLLVGAVAVSLITQIRPQQRKAAARADVERANLQVENLFQRAGNNGPAMERVISKADQALKLAEQTGDQVAIAEALCRDSNTRVRAYWGTPKGHEKIMEAGVEGLLKSIQMCNELLPTAHDDSTRRNLLKTRVIAATEVYITQVGLYKVLDPDFARSVYRYVSEYGADLPADIGASYIKSTEMALMLALNKKDDRIVLRELDNRIASLHLMGWSDADIAFNYQTFEPYFVKRGKEITVRARKLFGVSD